MKINKTVLIILIALVLTGCGVFNNKKPEPPVKIEYVVEEVKLQIFQPPLPKPITMAPIEWHVITADNVQEKIEIIKNKQGGEFVIFAMVPMSYENLAYNMQEIKLYIKQQNEIIKYYRSVTENEAIKDDSKDWIEKNEAKTPK